MVHFMFTKAVLMDMRRLFQAWAYYLLEKRYVPTGMLTDSEDDEENE